MNFAPAFNILVKPSIVGLIPSRFLLAAAMLFCRSFSLILTCGSAPTSITVLAPISDPRILAFILSDADTLPPAIKPLLPVTFISVPEATVEWRMHSLVIPPLADILAFSINFVTTFPPALIFPPAFTPHSRMTSAPASMLAPSTMPLTTMFPPALTLKLLATTPFTSTLPSKSILPVATSTFSRTRTSDTVIFPSFKVT